MHRPRPFASMHPRFSYRRRLRIPRDGDPVRIARLLRAAIAELEREQRASTH